MFQNRIVATGLINPKDVEAHVHNWRQHPPEQRKALEGILREIGWVQSVLVNRRTGRLIDGHLRVIVALDQGEELIPVNYVDLDEDEEFKALASLDAIAALAITDDTALTDLLGLISAEDGDLAEFLDGLVPDGPADFDDMEFDDDPILPDSEPEPEVKQLIFNVTVEQRDTITAAIDAVRAGGSFSSSEALEFICSSYLF